MAAGLPPIGPAAVGQTTVGYDGATTAAVRHAVWWSDLINFERTV
jgi:hypothetical protein